MRNRTLVASLLVSIALMAAPAAAQLTARPGITKCFPVLHLRTNLPDTGFYAAGVAPSCPGINQDHGEARRSRVEQANASLIEVLDKLPDLIKESQGLYDD